MKHQKKWSLLLLLLLLGPIHSRPLLTWSHDDPTLDALYFPERGAGFLLLIPARSTDPTREKWNRLESQHALFSGETPRTRLFSSARWAVNLPLTDHVLLHIGSGAHLRLQYEESSPGSTSPADRTSATWAEGNLDYQSYTTSLRFRYHQWRAEFSLSRHSLSLLGQGALQSGSASEHGGDWDAGFQGSGWTPGFRAGLSWMEFGLDFPARFPLQGHYSGQWNSPDGVDPMTGKPLKNGQNAAAAEQQRAGQDSLTFFLPGKLRLLLKPDPRLQVEYAFHRRPFQLQPSTENSDPWLWHRHMQGELHVAHQLQIRSQWQYGYVYGGALWLDGDADWKGLYALVPQGSLSPQLGSGITLGKPYRILAGVEIFPAIRIAIGVQYAP